MSQRIQAIGLIALLVATGLAAFWLDRRVDVASDAAALAALPAELAGWKAIDLPMEQDVSEMLRADANLQRAYLHPQGYAVYVYVGYYGTARGGTPEHTPDVCYPAQGWRIVEERGLALPGELSARELVVDKDGDRHLVHFWYRTATRSGIQSTAALRWNHFWARIAAGRGDGALVRLDVRIERDDVEGARQRLIPMDRAIESALADVWPSERVASGDERSLARGAD